MTFSPCVECGTPTSGSHCPDHQPNDHPNGWNKPSPRQRGYGPTWDKLSKRARRLQPFCAQCGSTEDLTADHSEQAWQRHAEGKPIRLQDIQVLCRTCNAQKGRARGSTANKPSRQQNIAHADDDHLDERVAHGEITAE